MSYKSIGLTSKRDSFLDRNSVTNQARHELKKVFKHNFIIMISWLTWLLNVITLKIQQVSLNKDPYASKIVSITHTDACKMEMSLIRSWYKI